MAPPPEFIQSAATAPAMGAALLAQLDDPAGRERIASRFEALHHSLRQDCASRCAAVLGELMARR